MKPSLISILLAGSVLAGCEGAIELGRPPIEAPHGVGGGEGSIGGVGGGLPMVVLPAFEPATLQMRVLLGSEYKSSIRDVFGTAAAAAITSPPDAALNGLTAIGAAQLSISTTTTQIYETNAFLAAQAALKDATAKAKLVPCAPTGISDAVCAGKILDGAGKRLFRRPLTAEERTTWLKIANDAAVAYGKFDSGVEFMLAGLLQSPNFLYRPEIGTPDGAAVKLTGYELATRISFFLTGSTPSEALLAAAEGGQLDTPEGIRSQAGILLSAATGPRSAAIGFFGEFLSQDGLSSLAKDPVSFPNYDPASAASMRQESQLFIQDVLFDQAGDLRTLFDADYTFVDAKLAPLYGVTQADSGFVRVQLPAGQPRSGLLTQTAFLSLMSHPASTSPTYRGKFVRERLLCETVSAPPANVNTNLPPNDPNVPRTLRQKLSAHMTNAGCASCHASMDPIGFGFESFDAIGQYRTQDQGLPIDSSGSLDGKSFADAKGLGALLKNDPRVMKCLARTLFRHGAGHVDLPGEARPLADAYDAFSKSGYKYSALLVELVASDAFRYGQAPTGVTP